MKLLYFDFRGRGEMIRLLLKLVGRDFEDVRISQEQWRTLKSEMPFHQLPVLELDDGTRFSQSTPILTYLAKEHGLYGSTSLERLEIDQILELILDYWRVYVTAFYCTDPARKTELMEDLHKIQTPTFLKNLESVISDTGHFVADKMSAADLAVYSVIEDIHQMTSYPKLMRLKENVQNVPAVKEYLATRPVTPY